MTLAVVPKFKYRDLVFNNSDQFDFLYIETYDALCDEYTVRNKQGQKIILDRSFIDDFFYLREKHNNG